MKKLVILSVIILMSSHSLLAEGGEHLEHLNPESSWSEGGSCSGTFSCYAYCGYMKRSYNRNYTTWGVTYDDDIVDYYGKWLSSCGSSRGQAYSKLRANCHKISSNYSVFDEKPETEYITKGRANNGTGISKLTIINVPLKYRASDCLAN